MENANISLKKYQNLIFPLIAILVGLAILIMVVVPQALKIPETNKQTDKLRKDLATLNQKIAQLNKVDVNQYKDNVNSSLTALPQEKDVPGAMILIFNLLRNNSLTLNGLSFGADTPSNGASVFLVKVDISGTKDSLANLITQLKESPRVVKAETLSTTSTVNSTTMEILIGLNSYFQPLPPSQTLELSKPVELPTAANIDTLQKIKDYEAKNAALTIEATASANSQLGKPDPFQ